MIHFRLCCPQQNRKIYESFYEIFTLLYVDIPKKGCFPATLFVNILEKDY